MFPCFEIYIDFYFCCLEKKKDGEIGFVRNAALLRVSLYCLLYIVFIDIYICFF